MIIQSSKNTQKGFTFVEIAIVMLISGLILATFISAYLRWKDILQSSQTHETIEVIADAMSAYVARNYRIPCPANPAGAGPEPFGAEVGSGANGASLGACPVNTQWEGIIPFTTLGLDASIARDGWGNYFTYQISPIFAQDTDTTALNIHAKCRTNDWIEGASLVSGVLDGGRNTNHRKANFCCAQPDANTLQIFAGPARSNPVLIPNPDGVVWYEAANEIADPNDIADPISGGASQAFYGPIVYGGGAGGMSGFTDMPVYAVISHGKTGFGAFLDGGGRTVAQGASEAVNATLNNGSVVNDQVIYDLRHDSSNDNTFYDDIVHWQTQSNLMARLRRDSCALP